MCDLDREQHPLLFEDVTEEEHLNTHHLQRRFRPMVFRGRASNNAKGAAAIIRFWPEHWSSSVTYWWIGLGMLAIVTFVIYNSIAALAISPAENFKSPGPRFPNHLKEIGNEISLASNCVFMHLFVEPNEEIDLNNYLPYIDIIAAKYSDFNYHLIVVTDDTAVEGTTLGAGEMNEIALNLLWSKNTINRNKNVNIVRVTMSKYMENSPLRKYWRRLPKQFIHFLTRAVSIWDKGGIAFSPTILTPRSPNSIYIEKLQKIFENFQGIQKNTPEQRNPMKVQDQGYKKKVNNIRDIIEALEQSDGELSTLPQHNPIEEESQDNFRITNNTLKTQHNTRESSKQTPNQKGYESHSIQPIKASVLNNTYNFTNSDTAAFGLLPKFLDFLRQNKPILATKNNVGNEKRITESRRRSHAIPTNFEIKNKTQNHNSNKFYKNLRENIQPMIIAAKTLQNDSFETVISAKDEESNNQFTIDLKGNLIASSIPCHAFIGSIFSNSMRYSHESVTDFIISEVSTFCKGLLSSCYGIDIILL